MNDTLNPRNARIAQTNILMSINERRSNCFTYNKIAKRCFDYNWNLTGYPYTYRLLASSGCATLMMLGRKFHPEWGRKLRKLAAILAMTATFVASFPPAPVLAQQASLAPASGSSGAPVDQTALISSTIGAFSK